MALTLSSTISSLLQALRQGPAASIGSRLLTHPEARSWTSSLGMSTTVSIPAITIGVPALVSDIWEGILRAVPKKKTSHMKKRHRQLAGKALKDVNAVNTCPGCGKPKKAHFLCPYCVAEIKESWKQSWSAKEALK